MRGHGHSPKGPARSVEELNAMLIRLPRGPAPGATRGSYQMAVDRIDELCAAVTEIHRRACACGETDIDVILTWCLPVLLGVMDEETGDWFTS